MNKREIADLTMAMAKSGDMIDLSSIEGIKVDKHSTGGVGDKTTLIVAPLAAAAGVPVAKMSGRGLGHTGGTIDKLESIPGFNVSIERNKFIDNVNKNKIALVGQTGNLVPADKKIYALRDVTATVSCIPLISSSIMSKKIAAGSDAIVLDVKTGSGAFMKDIESSFELAKEMVDIGTNVGRNTIAVITDMDEPLGNAIGNSLEVIESIETLKGYGPKDLEEVSLVLAGFMIYLGGKANTFEEGKSIAEEKLKSGEALEKLKLLIESQGGNSEVVNNYAIFPRSKMQIEVECPFEGYIDSIMSEKIGKASVVLGGGRETKESIIDYSVGIILHKKVGEEVETGDKLATIFYNDEEKMQESKELLLSAYSISPECKNLNKLIYGIVNKDQILRY
jgi:pyrimidine-nucleoside phosphorylase